MAGWLLLQLMIENLAKQQKQQEVEQEIKQEKIKCLYKNWDSFINSFTKEELKELEQYERVDENE